MIGTNFAKYNLSKGELSPEIAARVDVESRQAGLLKARNVIIKKYGGVTMRPGTRIVSEVVDIKDPNILIPFQYSKETAYALELGTGYMRPAALGGVVLESELVVQGITNATQAQVTADYHGFSVGDEIFFTNQQGMTEINEMLVQVVSIVDQNNFTIALDTTNFGVWTGSTGGTQNTAPPSPPPPPPVQPPVQPPPPPTVGGNGGDELVYDDFGVFVR